MDWTRCCILGRSSKSGRTRSESFDLTDEEFHEEHAKTALKIRSMYDSGVPFFTKDAIRDIHRQLQQPLKRGDTIAVKCLDGEFVEFDVEIGRTYPPGHFWRDGDAEPDPQLEYVAQKPAIFYEPMQRVPAQYGSLHLMYCNLMIEHRVFLRDKVTKELVRQFPEHITERTIRDLFESYREAWEASDACKQFRATLSSAKIAPDTNKIVGFAFATMCHSSKQYESGDDEPVRRSSYQHALLLTVRDVLVQNSGRESREIECYVQDPIYTPMDKAVLKEYGVTVVDDPEGFLEVDDSTAVISISPNVPVRQIVSDLARPSLMIWDTVDEEYCCSTDPITSRIKETMANSYDVFELPDDGDNFGEVSVYVRRSN